MKFDDILEFLFHRISGLIILMCSTVVAVLVMSGCAPLDLWGCMCYAMCPDDESCGDACISCADSWDTCSYNTCTYIFTCEENPDETCAWIECIYGPSGCDSECGNCYTDCGGCNLTLYEALFCTDAFCPSCNKPNGYTQCTYGNCTTYCNGLKDPDSPIYNRVYLFDIDLMNANGSRYTTFELYQNTLRLPTPNVANSNEKFAGYFTEMNGRGTMIANEYGYIASMPASSTPLYAHFVNIHEGVKYNFIIYDQDGNVAKTFSATYGDDLSYQLPTFTTVGGMDLVYKATSDYVTDFTVGKNGAFDEGFTVFDPSDYGYNSSVYYDSKEINIYTSYVPKTYSITVVYPDGDKFTGTYDFGTELYSITVNSIDGKTFAGFAEYNGADVYDLIPRDSVVTATDTVYAIYGDNVTVKLDGVDYTYYEGQTVTLPVPTDIPVGKEFAGWKFDNTSFGTNIYTEITVTLAYEGITMSPTWRNASYKITYMSDGVNVGEESYSYGDERAITSVYAKSFHTFDGWYLNENLTGNKFTAITAATYGDLTLYAKFIPKTYTVVLDPAGGSISGYTKDIVYGSAFTLPKPTRTGSNFKGWYYLGPTGEKVFVTDADGVSKFTFTVENLVGKSSEQALSTLNFTAEYEVSQYTVKFIVNGAEYALSTVPHGNTVTAPTDPDVKGYNFIAWKTASGDVYDFATSVTGDITLYAELQAKTYVIFLTVKSGEGTITNPTDSSEATIRQITYTYGQSSIDVSTILPIREGYTFTGWYCNGVLCIAPDGTVLINNLAQVLQENGTTTLEARWVLN